MSPRLPVLALVCALVGPAMAQPLNVAVSGAWARASAGPANTGAIYATVTASQPDRLTGASTPVANMAELHRSMTAGSVMEMRLVTDGLPLTPGTPVHLQPGGYHFMVMGLKQPLKRGDRFPVTFTFQHSGPVTAEVTVAGPGATQPEAAAPAKQ